jgi:hypothetical protein
MAHIEEGCNFALAEAASKTALKDGSSGFVVGEQGAAVGAIH